MTKKLLFKLQLQGPDFSREVTLKPGITNVGRDPGNEIQLPLPKVSRKHASFECLEAMCLLTDLDSANGTLLNGQRIQANIPIPLNEDSEIMVDVVHMRLKIEVIDTPDQPLNEPAEDTVSKARAVEQQLIQQEGAAVPAPVAEPVEAPAAEEARAPEEEKEKPRRPAKKQPPQPPSQPPGEPAQKSEPVFDEPDRHNGMPPGLSTDSVRLLDYLPGIYHTPFMNHFLALFESILLPVEWNIDNFDLFLSPCTAPLQFLPWLSDW
ncbi:MAG: FHA domain-containing protein, partial [Anaerolineaceae bacterium]